MAVAATATIVLVSAGAEERPHPRPTSTIGAGTHICVVVGTPGPEGSRFRIPLNHALWKAHRELATTGSLVEARGPGVAAAIERFVGRGCDLIAATGVEAGPATLRAAREHPSQHFALIGGTIGAGLPNVAAVNFHTEQAAFLAGYLAAALSQTGIVGAFGSIDAPQVVRVLNGFSAGVQKLNADRELAIALLGWDAATQTGLFTDSVDDPATGKRAAQRLVAKGADIVLAVAGDASRGAAGVLHGVGDSSMIRHRVGLGPDRVHAAPVDDHRPGTRRCDAVAAASRGRSGARSSPASCRPRSRTTASGSRPCAARPSSSPAG